MGRAHTVKCSVHATNIDQQANHGHADRSFGILQQLLFEYLAALAALGHGIDVDFGKGETRRAIAVLGETLCLVIEDKLQEVVLDVLAPKGNAIFLLQVSDLVAGVD